MVSKTLQDWRPGLSRCFVLSRPQCLPLCSPLPRVLSHRSCLQDGLWCNLLGQAGHEGRIRRSRVKQSHTVKKQLRSRWGKTGKRQEGKNERGKGRAGEGSGQGGGAALYGQDSARKAGGESRDVIPQLYPAVTMGGEVERRRGEVGRDGRGEKGHGGDKERKEETGLSRAPGAEDLALPDGVGAELQLKKQRFGSGRAGLSACTGEREIGIAGRPSPGPGPRGSLIPCLCSTQDIGSLGLSEDEQEV